MEPETELDPWEDLFFEDRRKARHEELPALTAEDVERAMRVQRVVPVNDEGKYVDIDPVGDQALDEAPRKEEAVKSSASAFTTETQIDPAKPEEFIYGGSILYGGTAERENKRARKSKILIDMQRNEIEAAQAAANMRTWKETSDLIEEMLGYPIYDYWRASPSKDEADTYLVVNQADMTKGLSKPKVDVNVRNYMTGLIRGNFIDKGQKHQLHSWDGPWVLLAEVLEVVNRVKGVDFGFGTFLELMCHDNKGRLSFKGPIDVAATPSANQLSLCMFDVYMAITRILLILLATKSLRLGGLATVPNRS